jgi:hypothetical protein
MTAIHWKWFLCGSLSLLLATAVAAQEANDAELLRKQLKDANDKFEKALQEHRQIIDSLNKRIEVLEKNQGTNATNAAYSSALFTNAPTAIPPWSPAAPLRIGAGQNYLNLSFDGLFAAGSSTAGDIDRLEFGGHDPKQRGFTVQNLETTFDGKVDPYFRAQANIVLSLTPGGETTVESEEAYAETMSLPANLQVKGGMFLTEFGRINATHPHTWDFADAPVVHARLMGPDGVRNPGLRISWLAPTPFYSELFFAVQNSRGDTAHSFDNSHEDMPYLGRLQSQRGISSVGDLLFTPRYAVSFDLSDSQTLLAGVSAAFGPNASGPKEDTQLYGLDLFYKWKPVNHHAGYPFVTWQTEAMLRRFGAAASMSVDLNGDTIPDFVPRETLWDYGFYSQVAYGFHKGWVAALRGDYVSSDIADYEKLFGRDPDRASRWRLSPNLTWYPTEFSKLRLQYNYDDRAGIGMDHSVWMQFEFLLGSHAAHKF